MHLTNYSVNKKNSEYQSNDDDQSCQGHKWYERTSLQTHTLTRRLPLHYSYLADAFI